VKSRGILAALALAALIALGWLWLDRTDRAAPSAAPTAAMNSAVSDAAASSAEVSRPAELSQREARSDSTPTRSSSNDAKREPSREIRLRGVVSDESGAARAEESFRWSVVEGGVDGGLLASGPFETDARGAFEVEFEHTSGETIEFALADERQRIDERTFGRWRLPAESADGLTLRPSLPHLIAAGTVRDRDGAPLPDVRVRATYSDGQPRLEALRLAFLIGRVTNARGEFEIHGYDDGVSIDLTLERRGQRERVQHNLRTPALGLELVSLADSVIGLALELAIDEGPGAQHIRAAAVDAKGAAVEFLTAPDVPPRLRVARPLSAIEYAVEVVDRRTGVVLARVEGVQAPAFGTATDPRLAPLDLRGKLRFVRVATVTSAGQRIGEQSVQLVTPEGGRREFFAEVDGGLEFALPLGAPDLEAIDALGQRRTLIDGGSIVVVE